MKVLGIETSCDETAAAVVEDGVNILSNQIASQVEIHARYGGIVPEVASRQHILAIIPILKQAMAEAGITWGDVDGIAVTIGPGLAGSLLVGVNVAKAMALARGLPITGVNYLEGHITLDKEDNFKLVGIWDQDTLKKVNIQKVYTANWRQGKGGMLWNTMETSLNSGKQKIYDVLASQYRSAMKDILEGVYLSMVTGPTSASDDLSPNSINTWLRVGTASSTGGWTGYQSRYNDGSTPGTAYDTAGLASSASTNSGWR